MSSARIAGRARLVGALAALVTLAAACSAVSPILSPVGNPAPTVVSLVRTTFKVLPSGSTAPDVAGMDMVRGILQQRLNATGIVDPIVGVDGVDRIVVDLPAGIDPTMVEPLILRRGILAFVPLPAATYGDATHGGPTGVVDGQPLPKDPALKPLFTGDHLISANPGSDQTTSGPVVAFTLDDSAARLFAEYTRDHVGDYFAIVVDDKVIATPSIREVINGGSGQIAMGGDPDAVARMNELVDILKYGSLPFQLERVTPSASPSP